MGSMKKALKALPDGNLENSNSKKYAEYQFRIWTKILKFSNLKSHFFFHLIKRRHKTPSSASARPQRRVRGMGNMKKALKALPTENLEISNSKKYTDYHFRIKTKIREVFKIEIWFFSTYWHDVKKLQIWAHLFNLNKCEQIFSEIKESFWFKRKKVAPTYGDF